MGIQHEGEPVQFQVSSYICRMMTTTIDKCAVPPRKTFSRLLCSITIPCRDRKVGNEVLLDELQGKSYHEKRPSHSHPTQLGVQCHFLHSLISTTPEKKTFEAAFHNLIHVSLLRTHALGFYITMI